MSDLNLDNARHNMVVQQIRTWDVFDDNVLELIETTPRDAFVPADCKKLAYAADSAETTTTRAAATTDAAYGTSLLETSAAVTIAMITRVDEKILWF